MKRYSLLAIAFFLSFGLGPARGSISAGSSDPALEQPRVIANPPSEYATAARKWQGISGIERAPNGRLWAVWYSGGKGEGPDNYVVLVTSGDDGRTWSEPKLVIATQAGHGKYLREFDPCLWVDPTGRLWVFWAQSIAHWDGRGGVWAISISNPNSAAPQWSAPRRLADGIMLNKPIVLASGSWLFSIAGWRNIPVKLMAGVLEASGLPRESVVHTDNSSKGSNVYISDDQLRTIRPLGQVRVPDTWFDENEVVERSPHSLWMLVRTTYGIGQASSSDNGKEWTSEGNTKLGTVNSRFFLRKLHSGKLLLVSNLPPEGTKRSYLTARLSSDGGKTWGHGILLDAREGVAYPDGVQAPDGRIYIVYDHDRQGAGEILLSIVTERDILTGHPVSKQARIAVVINKLSKGSAQTATTSK